MSLSEDHARRAIRYTQRVLGITPSNHIAERIRTLGGSTQCVASIRAVTGPNRDHDQLMNIRRIAGGAKRRRCGNCGEYAAVAFDYLMHTNCPLAIEYAGYVHPGDHAFVIIGRPNGTSAGAPATWGREVVVADAWSGRIVSSTDYWDEMPAYPGAIHAPFMHLRYQAHGDYPQSSLRETFA